MNQQTESDFIVSQLKRLPRLRDHAIAALGKKDLSNNQRRQWLTMFKRFTRMHRDCLFWAEWDEALPPAQLAELWREFVETGAAFCDGQEKIITANLESAKLTIGQRCALVNLFVSVVKLSRNFEAYKDEIPAVGSPLNSPPQ
jgi:hypothetical protein